MLEIPWSPARYSRVYRQSAAANELYTRGRAQLLRRTEEATRAAVEAFESAIELDPDYALAHAGLALASAEMHLRYPSKNSGEDWERRAMRSAHRALDLHANLGEAHEALAAVFRKMEFDRIERLRRAAGRSRSTRLWSGPTTTSQARSTISVSRQIRQSVARIHRGSDSTTKFHVLTRIGPDNLSDPMHGR